MRIPRALYPGLCAIFLLSGCASPPGPHSKKTAGVGALIGAGAGALAGNPFLGFFAGSAIGAAAGREKERVQNSAQPWEQDELHDDQTTDSGSFHDPFVAKPNLTTAQETPSNQNFYGTYPQQADNQSGFPRQEDPAWNHSPQGDPWQATQQPESNPYYVPQDSFSR